MRFVIRAAACAAVAVLAALAGTPLPAQVVLRPAPLSVTVDSLTKGAEVQVVNLGTTAVVLTSWTLEPFTGRDGQQVARQTRRLGGGLRVPARSRVVLTIGADSTPWKAAKAGTYQSYLVVASANGNVEAQILATKPEPAPTVAPPTASTRPALPLAREMTLHTWHGRPGEFEDSVFVPAWQGTEVNAGTVVLTAPGTAPALARLGTPRAWEGHGTLREYPVGLRYLRGGRTYTGRVYLGADTTPSGVTLTVHASHHLAYFLATVFVGVIAGLLVRRWTELGRPISVLRERVLLAERAFQRALGTYAAAGRRREPLEAEFVARRQAADTRIGSLAPLIVKSDQAEKELAAVGTLVEALEARAPELARLTAELELLRKVGETLAGPIDKVERPRGGRGFLPERPAALGALDTTLAGTQVTLDTLESARTDAAAQRAFLGRWAEAFQDTLAMKAWRATFGDAANGQEAEPLKQADDKLGDVLWALWKVSDAPSLDAAALGATLAEAERELRKVEALRFAAAAARESVGSTTRETASAARRPWLPGSMRNREISPEPAAWRRLLRRLLLRRLVWDAALVTAAFLVSLLVTLSKEFYGNPFGTFDDYMSVLTWSFGLTSTLTLLASGLAALQSTDLRTLLRR